MKKGDLRRLFILLFGTLLILSSLNYVRAEASQDPNDVVKSLIGIDPSKVPQSQEDIENMYLKKEWAKIAANSTLYGPFHRTFTNHPLIFKGIFGVEYSFTLTFLLTFILWVIVAFQFSIWLKKSKAIKEPITNYVLGVLATMLLAQLGFFNLLGSTIVEIIFRRDTWWVRMIIGLIFLGLMYLEFLASKIIGDYIEVLSHKIRSGDDVEHAKNVIKATAKSITETKKELSGKEEVDRMYEEGGGHG